MIPLSTAERAALENALVSSYSVRTKVFVTDLVGNSKADISHRLLGGQIDVDVTAEVSRTLQITLFDPSSQVSFDSEDPSEAAIYMSNMIEVHYGVKTPTMNEYIDIPVFVGPVVNLSRDEDEIELTAYGKEHLAKGLFWHNFNAKKGANKIDVIKRIMRDGAGETKFLLPEAPKARLKDDLSIVALKQTPWGAAQSIAKSMDRVLYYDGAGRLRMRAAHGNKVFTFEGGDDGALMSIPSITFNTEDAKNAVVVKGKRTIKAKKKGQKDKLQTFSAKAVVPQNHPLSPWKLGRPGAPRYLVEIVENDKIKSADDAARIAENRLTRLVEQTVEIAFDAQPIPHLEEYDRVSLSCDAFDGVFTLRQFSIPLTVGDTMSIGYNRRLLTVNRRRINTIKNSRTKTIHKKKSKAEKKEK